MERKEWLLAGIDQHRSVCAEIGALSHPLIDPEAAGARFIDYTDTDTLRRNYAKDSYVDVEKIVDVTAVWGDNTLLEAMGSKVDHIVASHVIEHVPDLVTWFSELRDSLREGGSIRLAVPDKRYTFDYLRQESRLSDVIQAHLVRARRPQAQSVLDFHLNAVRLDCTAAWDSTPDARTLQHFNTPAEAIEAAQDAINGAYRDVHCWVFTPISMALLFVEMARADLLGFACGAFHDTAKYTFEFLVTLLPSDDREAIVASWQAMAETATQLPDPKSLKIASLTYRLAEAGSRIADVEEQMAMLQQVIRAQALQIDSLEVAEASLSSDLNAMERSKSWRVTAPLRSAVRALHHFTA